MYIAVLVEVHRPIAREDDVEEIARLGDPHVLNLGERLREIEDAGAAHHEAVDDRRMPERLVEAGRVMFVRPDERVRHDPADRVRVPAEDLAEVTVSHHYRS